MNEAILCTVLLTTSILASGEPLKTKWGTAGLRPFSRVGRSDSDLSWSMESGDVLGKREAAGLFPFPRVGRSGSDLSLSSDGDNQDMKRQGLIPFPRVGRAGASVPRFRNDLPTALVLLGTTDISKRANGGESNGMWFGPRLGRRNKRSVNPAEFTWAFETVADKPSSTETYPRGLIPFIRCGRSGNSLPWSLDDAQNNHPREEYAPHFIRDSSDDDDSALDDDRDDEVGQRRLSASRRVRDTDQQRISSQSSHQ